MQTNIEHKLWSERYRPQKIEDCILPPKLKADLQGFADGEIVNSIFAGPPGTGKTTAAMAIAKEKNAEVLFLEGSGQNRGIDSVRTTIMNFATKISLDGEGRKLVIFDEADNLTNDAQLALRTTIETVSKNCAFILTCNFATRLIEPLHSRCPVYDFRIPKEDRAAMFQQFCLRVVSILKDNDIEFQKQAVLDLVKKNFPDYRKIMNTAQAITQASRKLTVESLNAADEGEISELVGYMKAKDYTKMRAWVTKTSMDTSDIIAELFKNIGVYFAAKSVPSAILHLHEGQKDAVISVDQQLALTALMTKLMFDAEWQ